MVLDDLYELIEKLQERIDVHAAALQKSEALTRYALIDPLLRGLGWDTGDPSQVLVEYRLPKGSQQGFADYALLLETGQPQIIVEAKSLNTPLPDAAMQALSYCTALGFPYFTVTDGRHWELYETFRAVPLAQKLVAQLDLTGSAADTCLQALALWRRNVVGGNVKVGAPPVVGASAPAYQEPIAAPPIEQRVELGPEWHRLSNFKPKSGSKPAAARLHDGKEVVAISWANLNAEILKHLKSGGHLTRSDLPFKLGNATFYLLNTVNDKGDGQPFKSYREFQGWFMNANYSAAQHMNNARGAVLKAGLDPDNFAVKLQ